MSCGRKNIGIIMPGRSRFGKQNIKIIGSALNNPGIRPDYLVPCGQCILCRLDKSALWASRLVHEAKTHDSACFLTLTYDDDHLPGDESLSKARLRKFFNDLRGRLGYAKLPRIKFFAVGEYGSETRQVGRYIKKRDFNPHYHAIIFGSDFSSPIAGEEPASEGPSRSGAPQWSHGLLRSVWPDGRHTVSKCTFESAAYVARYSLKKVTGRDAHLKYAGRQPEFQSTSNGLGKEYFRAWQKDIYPSDSVVVLRGDKFVELIPPRYYDYLLEKSDPDLYLKVKAARADAKEPFTIDSTKESVYFDYLKAEVKTLVAKDQLIRSL